MLLNSAISFSLESAFASRRGTVCKNEKANAAGNLTFTGATHPDRGRHLTWTEDNRLIKVTEDLDPQYHSFYRYDAGGERTYKLVYRHKDSRPPYVFYGATMYPSPFLVITPTGYTKHYYAGTERIAAQIGKGKFANVNTSIANADSTAAKLTAVNSIAPYLANYATPQFTYLNTLPILSTTEKEIYYYHTDHLGSSAWVTDTLGQAVQHLAYLPWGEPYVTQKTGNFNPTYTFSGKERDEETGYSYFGQRFYDSQLSFWLSVDPMRHKYPSLSPFNYCANNPVNVIDPNGTDTAFMTPTARKDFLAAMNTVNSEISYYIVKRNNSKTRSGYKRFQEIIDNWNKLKKDFDYICRKDTPLNTYTSNPDDMKEYASQAAEDNGFTIITYDSETNKIMSSLIYVKPGRTSSYIHENRHSRQPIDMSTYDKEVEAFRYQQIYNYQDVQELIDDARRIHYPNERDAPVNYGIEQMVIDRYKIDKK